MHRSFAFLAFLGIFAPIADDCLAMDPPVEGAAIIAEFEPSGLYAGHWGIDFGTPPGTEVVAGESGVVSFAGIVVGNRTVTVDHGGGMKSSYSYLSSISVEVGERVGRGRPVGSSGRAHGTEGMHFSVRIDGSYIDPRRMLSCSMLDPAAGLRLVPVSRRSRWSAYPVEGEKGHTRRNFRSASYRTSHRWRSCLPAMWARRGFVHPRRCPVAES